MIFMNMCNDVKELIIYGIEGIIWVLEKGKNLIENIDIDELIIGK